MDRFQLALVIGVTLGLIASYFTVRTSLKTDSIKGGAAAHVLHYLACLCFSIAIPFVFVSLLLGHALQALPIAVGLLVLAYGLLLGYGALERPAVASAMSTPQDDRGWTEEDARRSGL